MISTGIVSGVVLDAEGNAVEGAAVMLFPPTERNITLTGRGGRFVHPCVPSGDVTLSAGSSLYPPVETTGMSDVKCVAGQRTDGIVIRLDPPSRRTREADDAR
jgi:hypothetical protein